MCHRRMRVFEDHPPTHDILNLQTSRRADEATGSATYSNLPLRVVVNKSTETGPKAVRCHDRLCPGSLVQFLAVLKIMFLARLNFHIVASLQGRRMHSYLTLLLCI